MFDLIVSFQKWAGKNELKSNSKFSPKASFSSYAMMASNTFTSRLLRLKHARQLKLSRGSMTAADNALSLECLLERAAPPSQAALQPKPYRQVPGPRAYPVIGGIHHYMPGGS